MFADICYSKLPHRAPLSTILFTMSFTLWCLIENDISPSPFFVTVSPSISIDELKKIIKAEAIDLFQGVCAPSLNLLKVGYF